jgi:hypothetical protein
MGYGLRNLAPKKGEFFMAPHGTPQKKSSDLASLGTLHVDDWMMAKSESAVENGGKHPSK